MEKSQKKRSTLLVPTVLVVLWCALPSLFLYCNNAYEVPLGDVLIPLIASVLLGIILFFTVKLPVRNADLAALVTVICMGLFLNFNYIVRLVDLILPDARVRAYYAVAAVLGATFVAVVLLTLKKKPAVTAVLCRLALIALVVVLLINIVTAVPNVVKRFQKTSFSSSGAGDVDAELPNLYYILADEYASFPEMEKYYGFDNAAFAEFLDERGFCVSDNSFNRGGGTIENMADNVNLAPVTNSDMTLAEYTELFNNGVLYGVLEGMGYDLNQLGTLYPLPRLLEKTALPFSSGAATVNGETAFEILVKNSMLMPLPNLLYWRRVGDSGDMAAFDYLDDPNNYTAKSNRAIFLYVCCPHPPFYYDAEGNAVDPDNWQNWTDPSYYLGQYQYITMRLTKTVTMIQQQDPNAVILIQSDHGLRYHADSSLPHTFWIEDRDQKQIFNALCFGGNKLDITGLSGYNTWRALLNALGGDYPLLPQE